MMINWSKGTKTPKPNEKGYHRPVIFVTDFWGIYFGGYERDVKKYCSMNTRESFPRYAVTAWCYQDELLNTLPEDIKRKLRR